MHPRPMFSADVSWRWEPGINRAYVWLSDGSVAGYLDLNTWQDHAADPGHLQLIEAVMAEWVPSTGVPCAFSPVEPLAPLLPRGLHAWLSRRRLRREHARALREYWDWRFDRPLWRIPTDPPHGGWRDLVRNEAGESLWQHVAELPTPPWYALAAKKEVNNWRRGAAGEETVAAELWRLARSSDWRFVHSVPVGSRGSDIDHVLVGPSGVFTINTKAPRRAKIWVGPNTFLVNGHRQPFLRNSRHEATRASRLLSAATGFEVDVHPLIVVVDPEDITYRNPPNDVTVVTRRRLKRWASGRRPRLDADQVEAIFAAVRRSTTWV